MSYVGENWELIKETLKKEYDLSIVAYNTWIAPLKFHSEEGDVINVLIPGNQAHILNYIIKKYKDFFQVTISELMDHNYDVNFILETAATPVGEEEVVERKLESTNDHLYRQANLVAKYTFDNFVVGNNNNFAHSAALAVAESPGEDFNPLFIYGGSGLGKTHLMHSIGHYIIDNNPNMKVLYVNSETFTNEVIEGIRSGSSSAMNKLRDKYRTVDVLLIDDIQFIIGKESTQNEFFNTFNTLYNEKKQIILSSDKPPKEIKTLDERIRSRFECGVPIDIHEPDYETRMAILKNKAEIDNLTGIPDEVFTYIAENITNNIRELEGALNKIGVFCKLVNEEVTLEVAKDSLKDIINKDHDVQITPDLIIKTVSEHLGINEDDIRSKKRSQDIATARQIVMYLCREYTVLALKSIGNTVGGKDHATVINGIKRVEEKINKDPAFKASIDTIIKKLNPNK